MTGIKVNNYDTTSNLSLAEAGWSSETTIENHTGEPLYLLMPCGTVQEIAPLYANVTFGKRVLIRHLYRPGLVSQDVNMFSGRPTIHSAKFPLKEIEISYSRLTSGPCYVDAIGASVCLARHCSRMVTENHMDPQYVSKRIVEFCETYFRSGGPSPILISANCHDKAIEHLYIEVNHKLMSVMPVHNLDVPEELVFMLNRNEEHTRATVIDFDWSKNPVREETICGETWVFGTSASAVQGRINERNLQRKALLTKEETKAQLDAATEDLNKKLEAKNIETENLKKELALTKQELDNTKLELSKANDISRMSYEQQTFAQKYASQVEDRKLQEEKRQFQREQAQFSMEQDRVKAETDYNIASAKVRKEELSVQSAAVGNTGTAMKTAAVVIPIVASAALWFAKVGAMSSLVTVGTGVGGAAVAGFTIIGAGEAICSAVRCVGSVITNAVNIISSGVRKVCSWLFD